MDQSRQVPTPKEVFGRARPAPAPPEPSLPQEPPPGLRERLVGLLEALPWPQPTRQAPLGVRTTLFLGPLAFLWCAARALPFFLLVCLGMLWCGRVAAQLATQRAADAVLAERRRNDALPPVPGVHPVVHGTPGAYALQLAQAARAGLRQQVLFALFVFLAVVWYAQHQALVLLPLSALWLVMGYAFFRHVDPVGQVATIARAEAGARSEQRVGQALAALELPGTLLHGHLLGGGGDADHVLVSSCLVVVETKTGSGRLSVKDDQVTVGRKVLYGNPLEQVARQARALSRITAKPVSAIVCVVDGTRVITTQDGLVLCGLRDLPRVIASLPGSLTPKEASKLAARLRRVHAAELARRKRS